MRGLKCMVRFENFRQLTCSIQVWIIVINLIVVAAVQWIASRCTPLHEQAVHAARFNIFVLFVHTRLDVLRQDNSHACNQCIYRSW